MAESFTELFSGIAIVIDDEIHKKESTIKNITTQLDKLHVPYLEWEELPSNETIANLSSISMIILDWKLNPPVDPDHPEVRSSHNSSQDEEDIVSFINNVRKTTYCPIFIFTDEPELNVKNKLEEKYIPHEEPCPIFVKPKNMVLDEKIENTCMGWLKKSPQMYLLKKLDKDIRKAETELFQDFEKTSPQWPSILLNTFKEDFSEPQNPQNSYRELRNILFRNIENRLMPPTYEENFLASFDSEDIGDKTHLKQVLEESRFIKQNRLMNQGPRPGDLFKHPKKSSSFLLNIRAECDSVREDAPQLYCLLVTQLKETKVTDDIFKNGQFIPKIYHQIIPCINNMIIEIDFRKLEIYMWSDLKNARQGRILPPFINTVQQRYGLYFQRVGLPRIPKDIFPIKSVNKDHKQIGG